jgi:type IV pilus assembly protein PilB
MAELDISERRVPQDGRVGLTVDGHHVDLRVVSVPTVRGEGVVMRILDKDAVSLDLAQLGMQPSELARFARAYGQAYGAVLVTGPTGSGKSTTLYAALHEVNNAEKNIITIEDPVEYEIDGITQIQVNPKAGLLFETGLRAIVRADPDIIMVGEIRDRETAQIAVESALTGHLVLSTLHTNDAPATISRLLNMGVEPFLITASVNLVLAQRLARKVCADCKAPAPKFEVDYLKTMGLSPEQIASAQMVKGTGCRTCNGTGYKGRVALYEVMRFNENLKEIVLQGGSTAELKAAAIKAGMVTLRASGILKCLAGVTTPEEVSRVTMAD